jgi:acylaminoacyl-peptidase
MEPRKAVTILESIYRLSRTPASGLILGPTSAQLTFSQHDPRQGKAFRFTEVYSPNPLGQIMTDKVIADQYSPSRQLRLVVREGEKKEQQFFELWNQHRLLAVKDLKAEHHQVIIDDQFGQVSWSPDEKSILYIAEKKKPEEVSVWDADESTKNVYRENFGETLTHVTDPGLFLFNWADRSVQAMPVPSDVFPAYPTFHPRDCEFVFVGYQKHAYKLGLRYMLDRKTTLYRSRLEGEAQLLAIPDEFMAALCPKFNPAGKLLLFGVPHTLAHSTGCGLLSLDWSNNEVSTLLPVMETSQPHFSGLYFFHANLIRAGWLDDDKFLFESAHRANDSIFTIDSSGEVTELQLPVDKPYSSVILDICRGDALISVSNLTRPPQVYRYSSASSQLTLLEPNTLQAETQEEREILEAIGNVRTQVLKHRDTDIESVLYWTKPDAPLVLLIHGGPHSSAAHDYIPSRVALVRLGYNVLNVNYRGSVGFGRSQVEVLHGHTGEYDLSDVLQAVEEASQIVSTSRLVALGGSHGGFLSAHLAATGKLAASIVINGVIDIASMAYSTDITDWCFAETVSSACKYPMSAADVQAMYQMSPVSRAAGVNCPSLIIVGGSDQRVPASQSMEWYRLLKGTGRDVTLLSFPQDGHAIETPKSAYEYAAYQLTWLVSKVPPSQDL